MAEARILIVEDEIAVARDVENKLKGLGYAVPTIVSAGEDAIMQAAETGPDLVLMDVQLTGEMDGVTAAEEIQARFDIPIVYLAACADDKTLERAKISGPFGYILKPVEVVELLSAVEVALYKHGLEKRLRESEARYRTISELTSDFTYTFYVEPDGTLVPEWVTTAFAQITGFAPDEVEARGDWMDFIHPDDLLIVSEHIQTVLSGQSDDYEFRIVTKNGETRWLRVYSRPTWDEGQGRVVRIYGAAQDITDQKRAQEALQNSEFRYRTLVESAPVGIGLATPDGMVLMSNAALCQMTGYSAAESKGLNERDIYQDPEDRSLLLSRLQTDGVVSNLEVELRRKDSTPFYAKLTAIPFIYGGRDVILTITEDVTERRQGEDELRRYRDHLEELVEERTAELTRANERLQQEIVERRRAEETLRRRNQELTSLNRASQALSSTLDLDQVLVAFLEEVRQLLGALACSVWLIDQETDELTCSQAIGLHNEIVRGWRLAPGEGIAGSTIRSGESLIVPDAQTDERYYPGVDHQTGLSLRSILSVPLKVKQRVIGVLQVVDVEPNRFGSTDLVVLEPLAAAAATHIENARLYQEAARLWTLNESIVQGMEEGIVLLDTTGQITFVNRKCTEILGYGSDELIGIHWGKALTPERAAELENESGDQSRVILGQYETVLLTRQGRRVPVTVSAHPLYDEGHFTGVLAVFTDITERKQAEEALTHERDLLQALMDNIPDTIYFKDTASRFTRINNAQADLLGISDPGQAIGRTDLDFFDPEFARVAHDDERRIVKSGQPLIGKVEQVRSLNGDARWFSSTKVPIVNKEGQVSGIVGISRDITEHKRAEEALAWEADVNAALAELSQALISPASLDDISFLVLDLAKRLTRSEFGYVGYIDPKSGRFSGDDPRHPTIPPDHIPSQRFLSKPALIGETLVGQVTLATPDRDYAEQDRMLVERLASLYALAIQHMWAQAEIQQRTGELAALNKAGQVITSSLDLDTVLPRAMAEARAMLDVEAVSVLLHDTDSDELVFAAAASPASDVLVGTRMPATAGIAGWALQNGQPVLVRDTHADPRFYDRIDDLTNIDTRTLIAMPLQYKGATIGVIEAINKIGSPFDEHDLDLALALANSAAIAIENARLYEAEREQRRLVEQSQAHLIHTEKMAALGRLAASIAHEINNPLQAVLGCMRLAEEELQGRCRTEKLGRHLDVAMAETRRISAILRRMHDFYRRSRDELEPIDVHTVLESVLALSAKQLQHSDVIVECDWVDDPPIIRGNADHLRQVFLNLLINAIDAMPQGGTLGIRTTFEKGGEESGISEEGRILRIEFSDTGVGISPEARERLFEPFFTTKKEGTGLGLSISYGIIESHNGQMLVASQEGEGTTFTILLPAA